jgi:type IV pilus assembly protein PilE
MRSAAKPTLWGFSLIELLIVVAIIGIIGAYAFPSYMESVRKGKRSDAVSALSSAAQWMERNFSDTARYDQLPSGSAIALPDDLAAVPQGSSATARYYNIQIAAVTQTTYRLEASPVNSMAGDACGTFVLTQTGAKSLSGNSKSVNDCWRR